MADGGVEVRTSSGRTLSQLASAIAGAPRVTRATALLAVEAQRTRMLRRTAEGKDVHGRPFAAYSADGPYYHNPNGRLKAGAVSDKQQRAAVNRLKRKVPGSRESRTGKTLKFESYAAFKKWLGRVGVDLRGPKAPHMLQAMAVKVTGQDADIREMRIGIYGPSADRAQGHNDGAGRLPKREFFGASREDLLAMGKVIGGAVVARLTGKK